MPQNLQDQIQKARQSGYNDDEILTFLESQNKLDKVKTEKAKSAGYKTSEILNFVGQREAKFIDIKSPEFARATKKNLESKDVLHRVLHPELNQIGLDKTAADVGGRTQEQADINAGRIISLGAMGAGAAAGTLSANPVVGAVTMGALEELLRDKAGLRSNTIFSQEEPSVVPKMIEGAIENELGGRLIGGIFKGGGAIKKGIQEKFEPGSVVNLKNFELQPTTGQATNSKILSLIENLGAGKSKEQSLLRSHNLVTDKADELLRTTTGRSDIDFKNPFKQAKNIENQLSQQFDRSQIESTTRGNALKLLANANKVIDPVTNQNVIGPINTSNLLKEAKTLLQELNTSDIPPDPQGPLVKALESIIANNTEQIGPTGIAVPKLRNFGDVWETKKVIDDIAFANPRSQANFIDARFKRLSSALDKDIEGSLDNLWGFANQAKSLWKETRSIVAKRHELFDKAPIEKLVNETVEAIPEIDKVIANPTSLKKAMVAGHIQIPNQNGFEYLTSNIRKDLQGYELTQLFNQAKKVDPQGNIIYDGEKLLNLFTDANKQESYKVLFNSKQRADITQFFKNIAMVERKGPLGMTPYWMLRTTGAGFSLGSGILTGMLSPSTVGFASGTLGIHVLGKLLTKPETARIMVAMAQQGPLGMPERIAGRVIGNALKGQAIELTSQDGTTRQGKFNNEGKIELDSQVGFKRATR